MGFFKLGVCPKYGVTNPYSHFPQLVSGTLSTDMARLAAIVNFTDVDFPHPYMFVRQLDPVVLGPSSNVVYKGAHERQIINVPGTTSFTIYNTVDFAYNEDDPFSVLGTNLPGGWVPSTNEAAHIEPEGIYSHESVLSDGYMDKYRMYVRFHPANEDELELVQNMGDFLLNNTKYLVGCWYKYSQEHGNSPDVSLRIDNGVDAIVMSDFALQANWTHKEMTLLTTGSSQCKYYIHSEDGVGVDPAHYSSLYANLFYVCHAKETDDEDDGIFTFDDYPAYGSVRVSEVDTTGQITLLDQSASYYDPLGGAHRRPKFGLTCDFQYVSNNFYEQLRLLRRWQQQGNWLVFFHNTSEFLTRGMPPMMVGTIQLSNFQQPTWDLDKVSFTFTFREEA